MKLIPLALVAGSLLICSCANRDGHGFPSLDFHRHSYGGSSNPSTRVAMGFMFEAPDGWFMVNPQHLEYSGVKRGIGVFVRGYDDTPAIQFDHLDGLSSESDQAKAIDLLLHLSTPSSVLPPQKISTLGKLTGTGVRFVIKKQEEEFEYILFYPTAELTGVRIWLEIPSHADASARREMIEIVESVRFSASYRGPGDERESEPNQTSEPTAASGRGSL